MKKMLIVSLCVSLFVLGNVNNGHAISDKAKMITGASIAIGGGLATWYTFNQIKNYKKNLAKLELENDSDEEIKAVKGKLQIAKVLAFVSVLAALSGAGLGIYGLVKLRTASANPPMGIEEQLNALFQSINKNTARLDIDGHQVGIIFDPNAEALNVGPLTVADHILIVSDHSLPEEVMNRIERQIPQNFTKSCLSIGNLNGEHIFDALGL